MTKAESASERRSDIPGNLVMKLRIASFSPAFERVFRDIVIGANVANLKFVALKPPPPFQGGD